MELIDEIMVSIEEYVTDSMAVSNCLYIILEGYDIQKKSTDIVKYPHPKERTMRTPMNMGVLI